MKQDKLETLITGIPVCVKTDFIDSHDPTRVRFVCESTKMIDHADSSDRKWLTNHLFWAMRNSRRVTIYPTV